MRELSVSAYLGKLVEAELKRREALGTGGDFADRPAEDQALAALAGVRASIDELEAIAGRLARSAVAHGASWKDVATALKIDETAAKAAHRMPKSR